MPSQKKHHTKSWVAICSLISAFAAWWLFSSPENLSSPFPIPQTDIQIQIRLRATHPFLAEYSRTLLISRSNQHLEFKLFPDTGGYGRLNVYAIGSSHLRIVGPFETTTLRTDTLQPELQELPQNIQIHYLATFTQTADGKWRFVSSSERPESPLQPPAGA